MVTRRTGYDGGQMRRLHRCGLLFVAGLSIVGCASTSAQQHASSAPAPTPPPVAQVYFYPTAGQSPAQQDRDRYECYLWAVKQTGFDPSQPQLSPHQRVEVVPMPAPGHDTAVGAVTGAVIGAAVSRPHDALGGAVVGAAAGAIIGAASDTARQQQAERIQRTYEQRDAQRAASIEEQVQNYRRAMTACLAGRGYSVR